MTARQINEKKLAVLGERVTSLEQFVRRVAEELEHLNAHGDDCPANDRPGDGCDATGEDEGCDCFLLLRADAMALLPAPKKRPGRGGGK